MSPAEYEHEPIRGLPGRLPEGERLIWQGGPCAATLAVHALHARPVGLYFLGLAIWRGVEAAPRGFAATLDAAGPALLLGSVALALIGLYAWAVARTTVYTLTSRRLVLRVGVALQKAINVPFTVLVGADLRRHAERRGDIALALTPAARIGYAPLWPHVRPWRFAAPQPMLRAIPEAEAVAALLSDAVAAEAERRRDAGLTTLDHVPAPAPRREPSLAPVAAPSGAAAATA